MVIIWRDFPTSYVYQNVINIYVINMADKLGFNRLGAIIFGILGWVLATLLDATGIFGAIANLPEIGLFIGVLAGGFKDKIGL